MKFQVGDLVEATKAETTVRGRVAGAAYRSDLLVADTGWSIASLQREGFVVTVVESAKNLKEIDVNELFAKLDRFGSRLPEDGKFQVLAYRINLVPQIKEWVEAQ